MGMIWMLLYLARRDKVFSDWVRGEDDEDDEDLRLTYDKGALQSGKCGIVVAQQ